MNWKLANKAQLLQIILDETCSSIYKFEAAAEYKRRDQKGFWKCIRQEKLKKRIGR